MCAWYLLRASLLGTFMHLICPWYDKNSSFYVLLMADIAIFFSILAEEHN